METEVMEVTSSHEETAGDVSRNPDLDEEREADEGFINQVDVIDILTKSMKYSRTTLWLQYNGYGRYPSQFYPGRTYW